MYYIVIVVWFREYILIACVEALMLIHMFTIVVYHVQIIYVIYIATNCD